MCEAASRSSINKGLVTGANAACHFDLRVKSLFLTQNKAGVNTQTKVGIFALITIIIFITGFYFLKGINLFTTRDRYYAVFNQVDGLSKSNNVTVNGFKIGAIEDMHIDPSTGRVTVVIIADGNFKIPAQSLAAIGSTDLVGSKILSIRLIPTETYLKDGDTIKTEVKADLMGKIGDAVDPLVKRVSNTLAGLDTTLADVQLVLDRRDPASTVYKLNASLDNIHSITTELDLTLRKKSLEKTLDHLESITANVEKNNIGITNIISNVSALTDTLKAAQIQATVAKAREAIGQVDKLLKQINDGDGTISALIKDKKVYNDLDAAVLSLNSLLVDVKAHPFRYINISLWGGQKRDDKYKAKLAKDATTVTP
jgi:phospholipid/cholesterol/gamma-HCH transport system substrate-binding protein